MFYRFPASAAVALALTGMSATGAMAGQAAHSGAATITFRGGWRLAHVKLPGIALPRPRVTGGTTTTGDWSGYVDTGHNVAFRFIAANFTAPNVDCAASTRGKSGEALASTWVGLDGFNSDTIEQAGFEEECTSSTSQSYDGWYEMFPGAPVAVSGPKPGDALAASVYFNSTTGKYTLAGTDLTQAGGRLSLPRR